MEQKEKTFQAAATVEEGKPNSQYHYNSIIANYQDVLSTKEDQRPVPLKVEFSGIPLVLQEMNSWVLWRYVKKAGRWTKPPYQSLYPKKLASTTNPATWSTFAAAEAAYARGGCDGVGVVLTGDFLGVDIDGCVCVPTTTDGDGILSLTHAGDDILTHLDTYSEISPSGKGIRAFLVGTLPGKAFNNRTRGVELYDKSSPRYLTVTGCFWENKPLAVNPAGLLSVYNDYAPARAAARVGTRVSADDPGDTPAGCSAEGWDVLATIRKGKQAEKFQKLWDGDWGGYGSQSEADLALCNILAFHSGGAPVLVDTLFRQSGLYREKWEREAYRAQTVEKAVSAAQAALCSRSAVGTLRVLKTNPGAEKAPPAACFEGVDDETVSMLARDSKGRVTQTIFNVETVILNDPALSGAIGYNVFLDGLSLTGDLPWRKKDLANDYRNGWVDSDYSHLQKHLEKYAINNQQRSHHGLIIASQKNAFHPVRDFIAATVWDGVARAETLFIDFLGAEDSALNRTFSRKTLVAAVARVFDPGCKNDETLVLVGPQGVGKSTMVSKLGGPWFSDTLDALNHKDVYGQLRGSWIIEISELTAVRKTDRERLKSFLVSRRDKYRKSYARVEETIERQNIFIGTTNDLEFIADHTGGRRFWPMVVGAQEPIKDLWEELTEAILAQVWAEAFHLYKVGETWHLNKHEEALARDAQATHTEEDPLEPVIREYLEKTFPEDWDQWPIEERRGGSRSLFFGAAGGKQKLLTHVNLDMIANEALGQSPGSLSQFERKNINQLIRRIGGWEHKKTLRVPGYGRSTGFLRAGTLE